MKKSQLIKLIQEELQGYSKYLGKTKGGTSDEFMQILTKIAKGRPEDKQEGDKDFPPLPHEELHGYSQKTTPEGEHETWAVYFDPKTNTYNERHRVPGETVFGRKGNAERGNKILDKANPDNVDRILRGEKPVYEGEGDTMNLPQLIDYIKNLSPDTELWIPTIFPGGFGKDQTTRRTVKQAVEELTDVLDSGDHNQTQFKLSQDNPKFKKFSVIISPEDMKSRADMIRSMGSLD